MADRENNAIRCIRDGMVTTLLDRATFLKPQAVTVAWTAGGTERYPGRLWVADSGHHRICAIDDQKQMTVIAGLTDKAGFQDGDGEVATFF